MHGTNYITSKIQRRPEDSTLASVGFFNLRSKVGRFPFVCKPRKWHLARSDSLSSPMALNLLGRAMINLVRVG